MLLLLRVQLPCAHGNTSTHLVKHQLSPGRYFYLVQWNPYIRVKKGIPASGTVLAPVLGHMDGSYFAHIWHVRQKFFIIILLFIINKTIRCKTLFIIATIPPVETRHGPWLNTAAYLNKLFGLHSKWHLYSATSVFLSVFAFCTSHNTWWSTPVWASSLERRVFFGFF